MAKGKVKFVTLKEVIALHNEWIRCHRRMTYDELAEWLEANSIPIEDLL